MISISEKEVERLIQTLLPETRWFNRVFSVGGFVRDEFLGIPSKDLDLVVEESGGSEKLTQWIKNHFPEQVSNPYRIGAAYPIWHLKFFKDIQWKGQVFQTSGAEIDFADTQYGTLAEDILRRDFTVNMLLRDLSSGRIVDPTGSGLKDLKAGILRCHPDLNPEQPFKADPLRMLRAIRLILKYGWGIDPSVEEAMIQNAPLIQRVSLERVRDELIKIMDYGKLGQAISWMDKVGQLKWILPEVQIMKGVEQDRTYHSEGDVWTHTQLLLEKAKPGVIPQLAALLHDVGKPATQVIHEPSQSGEFHRSQRRIQFLNHENVGADQSEEILRRLKFDSVVIEKIKKLIRFHLRAHFSKDWSPKAVRKFVRDCGSELDEILDLSEIDSLSSYGPDGVPKENRMPELRKRIAQFTAIPIHKKSILTGDEVMQILNIPPGKAVGKALRILQEKEDEEASRGIVLNREEATSYLKSFLSKNPR